MFWWGKDDSLFVGENEQISGSCVLYKKNPKQMHIFIWAENAGKLLTEELKKSLYGLIAMSNIFG